MRIERLEYEDKVRGWCLGAATFHPDLTLFVGHSATDKRQILTAIHTLCRFAQGQTPDNLWSVAWDIRFSTDAGSYDWQGEFSGKGFSLRDGLRTEALLKLLPGQFRRGLEPFVLHETLRLNGRMVVERRGESVQLNGWPTDRHAPSYSALSLLGSEANVQPAYDGFGRIVFVEDPADTLASLAKPMRQMCIDFPTLNAIRDSSLPTYAKLAVVHENLPEVFRAIVGRVRERLPQVEDIGFDRVDRSSRFTDLPALRLLEKGTAQWLTESKISTDLLHSVLNLAAVALWPDNAVILIDDFESGLGVYCIEHVLEAARDTSRNLQVILTSDDPVVCNAIGPERRKVVAWQGTYVSVDDALDFEFQSQASTAMTSPMAGGGRRGRKKTDITADPGTVQRGGE
jgi:hypothetical protein